MLSIHTSKRAPRALVALVLAAATMAALAAPAWAAAAPGDGPVPRVSCKVEMDHAVLWAGRSQKAVVKVSLDALARAPDAVRAPVNLAIVLDRSGSMSGDKLENAKAAAIDILRRLGGQDLFSMVTYDHSIETLVPAQAASNADVIIHKIDGVVAGGDTALFGGVSRAAAEIRKHLNRDAVHRIVLLSDGLANVGPDSPEDLGRLGASLIKEGISVTTVGVGEDFNEDLMTQLARRSDGNTYFAAGSENLARIFTAELGDALSVVARRVRLDVVFSEHVHPRRIVGLDGRIRQNRVELTYNQLYGGQQKYALIDVELDAGVNGAAVEIATANVRYADAVSGEVLLASAAVSATFSDQEPIVQASRNLAVVNDYNVGNNAYAYEQAIDLADKGDVQQAAWVLNTSAEQLEKVGLENEDPRLLEKARAVKGQADALEKEGKLSKSNRKTLRTESYQDLQQQLNR